MSIPVVIDSGTFSIGDTSGDEFLPYQHGGIAQQTKTVKKMSFVSMLTIFNVGTSLVYIFTHLC